MSDAIQQAAAALRAGGLVALPTETVYGLGADAMNPAAVARIFALKGRPATHPLIVHIGSVAALDQWAVKIPDAARRLAEAFWPGPLTLILQRQTQVLDAVTGGQDSVGLRMPAHPLALALLTEFGGGIAAPSANRYGHVSATTAAHVREEFGTAVDFILDGGPCHVGIESTIVSFLGDEPIMLRPGSITSSTLAEVLGRPLFAADGVQSLPRAPGSDAAHYAPLTPAICVTATGLAQRVAQQQPASVAYLHYSDLAPALAERLITRRLSAEPAAYAQQLYAALRWADTLGLSQLLIETPPAGEEWLAVQDRLSRATGQG
ncbi:MAG: threonylcarbamoyl-AMP synthase [Gammaproteobacteria bacterium]|nr:threonylcarbamoyl-AMP synthase [Gammaproteobacteria bacterium]MBU2479308.1 threonylcarbamoyl-AMP synthase [Gammaproteobacteria bacterium]